MTIILEPIVLKTIMVGTATGTVMLHARHGTASDLSVVPSPTHLEWSIRQAKSTLLAAHQNLVAEPLLQLLLFLR